MDTVPMFPLEDFQKDFPDLPQSEIDETNEDIQVQAQTAEGSGIEEMEPEQEPATQKVSGNRVDADGPQHDHDNHDSKGSPGSRWLGSMDPGGPYPIGKLSMIMPVMDEMAYGNFLRDVEENGQVEPISIIDGEIIDGKHREWACRELGIEPVYEILPDDIDSVR